MIFNLNEMSDCPMRYVKNIGCPEICGEADVLYGDMEQIVGFEFEIGDCSYLVRQAIKDGDYEQNNRCPFSNFVQIEY